ncbi:YdcH family protein [Cognatiluteimonas telluris]|uniref:YdcH family protein n=1 Tax=Cognatiluteimonas telluris TaxID=1104775 RepID=UPI00140CBE69|nr:YdcH family protein [Lysobacter telluris]
MNQPTDPAELSRLALRVVELRQEHRDLDVAIATLQAKVDADELAIKRLKKRKLQLKDSIARIESALIPDEPA